MRFLVLATLLILTGCTSTQGIAPQYINPNNYANQDCNSLQHEIERISKLASNTEKQQSTLSTTGFGIGITGGRSGIYPTISFGIGKSGNQQKKQTLAQLYGEHDAMVLAARNKHCPFAQNIKIYGE